MNRTNHQTYKSDAYYRDFVKKQVGEITTLSTPPGSPRRAPRIPKSPKSVKQPTSPFTFSQPVSSSRRGTSPNSQKIEVGQSSPELPSQVPIAPSSPNERELHSSRNDLDGRFFSVYLECSHYLELGNNSIANYPMPFDLSMIPSDMELNLTTSSFDTIIPTPPSLQDQIVLPSVSSGSDKHDQQSFSVSSEIIRHRSSINILDNNTAMLSSYDNINSSLDVQSEQELTVLDSDENENGEELFQTVGQTITKTWLVLYGTVIRILDFLIGIYLSYEKHSLSLLRALSVISLVLTCM